MKLLYLKNSDKYKTVKEVLQIHFHVSKRLLSKIKQNNRILVNNKTAFLYTEIKLNDVISVDISFNEKSQNIVPIEMQLDIIFEDEAMLIINKTARNSCSPIYVSF